MWWRGKATHASRRVALAAICEKPKKAGAFCCCKHIINSHTLYSQQVYKQAMLDLSFFSSRSLLRGIWQSPLPNSFLLAFSKLSRGEGSRKRKGDGRATADDKISSERWWNGMEWVGGDRVALGWDCWGNAANCRGWFAWRAYQNISIIKMLVMMHHKSRQMPPARGWNCTIWGRGEGAWLFGARCIGVWGSRDLPVLPAAFLMLFLLLLPSIQCKFQLLNADLWRAAYNLFFIIVFITPWPKKGAGRSFLTDWHWACTV